MRAILISVQPQHTCNILNYLKTLEIRKSMPRCKLPIEVYIYCTKNGGMTYKYEDSKYHATTTKNYFPHYCINGKVVAKFTLNKVNAFFSYDETFLEDSCLTRDELEDYADNKNILYAWHIDNLVIFDKPRELATFFKTIETQYISPGGADAVKN